MDWDRSSRLIGLRLGCSRRAAEHPDRVAISDDTYDWTYAQFDGLRRNWQRALRGRRCPPADRVAGRPRSGIEKVQPSYAVHRRRRLVKLIDPARRTVGAHRS